MKEFIIGRHLNRGEIFRGMNLLGFFYSGTDNSRDRSRIDGTGGFHLLTANELPAGLSFYRNLRHGLCTRKRGYGDAFFLFSVHCSCGREYSRCHG